MQYSVKQRQPASAPKTCTWSWSGNLLVSWRLCCAQVCCASSDCVCDEKLLIILVGPDMIHCGASFACCSHTRLCVQEMIAAVHFAAAFQEVQGPVARVMKTLQPQHNPDVRRCAVACACALAPCLPRHQVGHTRTDDTFSCNVFQALACMSSSMPQVTDQQQLSCLFW